MEVVGITHPLIEVAEVAAGIVDRAEAVVAVAGVVAQADHLVLQVQVADLLDQVQVVHHDQVEDEDKILSERRVLNSTF